MRIPEHLTCLLRKLHSGQEATFRTGRGTKDKFQIGKEMHQRYILSPCLFNLYAECMHRIWLFATPWTVAHQAPLSINSPGKNTGVGCHAFLQGIFLTKGLNPCFLRLLHCRWILYHWTTREARTCRVHHVKCRAGWSSNWNQDAGRNNFRYADDTTTMAESEEELKSLLMKVKEESEKAGLKLSIQKIKIMASSPTTLWKINGEKWKQWQILFSWASKSLQMVTEIMKLKDMWFLEEKLWET